MLLALDDEKKLTYLFAHMELIVCMCICSKPAFQGFLSHVYMLGEFVPPMLEGQAYLLTWKLSCEHLDFF